MGATRPEEVITGTAGEGTAERPRSWNENLKIRKTQVKQIKDFIRGYVGRQDQRARHTETYVKIEDATRKRVGLPKTHSGTDTHQCGKNEVRGNYLKNNSTIGAETCQEAG